MDTNRSGWRDGGWRSRKLWFSVFAIFIVYLGLRLAAGNDTFKPLYETFVGGVVGISALFLAGNLGGKFVSTKATPVTTNSSPKVLVGQSKFDSTEASPGEQSPQ